MNISAPKELEATFIKQNPQKREMSGRLLKTRDFNRPLPARDRSYGSTLNFDPDNTEYTFSSSTHRILTNMIKY